MGLVPWEALQNEREEVVTLLGKAVRNRPSIELLVATLLAKDLAPQDGTKRPHAKRSAVLDTARKPCPVLATRGSNRAFGRRTARRMEAANAATGGH